MPKGKRLRTRSAAVLAGGRGSRLRSAVPDRQKVVADVAGVPFLVHLLWYLASEGIEDVILLLGHRANQVEELINDYDLGPMSVRTSIETIELGTAGAIRNAAPQLPVSGFWVLNGDTYFPVRLREMETHHDERGGLASLALSRADSTSDYGTVVLDDHGRITAFAEKYPSAGPVLVSGGTYLFSTEVLRFIPANRAASLEREVFPAMLSAGACITGYVANVQHFDMGTPERYAKAAEVLARRAASSGSTDVRR